MIDNGIGIAPEDLDKLFQPFVQIDSSLNRQHSGTGLGLALVQRLVELHGGRVTVTSKIDEGSCFTVYLPYMGQSTDDQNSQFSSPCQIIYNKSENSPVLIVDDSILAAEQLRRYLHELGLKTHTHRSGAGVVDKAIILHPMLILLDIILPDLSGWEVLKQLRTHPETKNIPVVVISVVDERSQALSLGATDAFVKPTNREQICQTINKLLAPNNSSHSSTDTPIVVASTTPVTTSIEVAKPPLILLAEDNQANIATISSYLGAKGYQIIMAKNGQEAVNLTKEQHPNLILMDIQMPGMDGLEAMRLIRADDEFKHTPMIALTALAMPGDREKCIAAGANDYLTKPIKLKFLVEKIQQLLNQVTGNIMST